MANFEGFCWNFSSSINLFFLKSDLPTKTDTPMVWYKKYIAKPTWSGHDQIRFTIKHASITFWVSTLIKLTISPARKKQMSLMNRGRMVGIWYYWHTLNCVFFQGAPRVLLGTTSTMYDFHNSTDTLKFWTEKWAFNKTFLFFILF